MLWQIIISVFSILCLVYYALLCIRLRKWDSTFSRFWLICGCAGLMFRYLYIDGSDMLPALLLILTGIFLINRGEDHPGDVSGREIGRTAGGLQVSDRVGRTGGREADHGFAAKKA